MLPRIVVAGRRDDVLGRTLSYADSQPYYSLEFCPDRHALVDRLRHARPAALVVGLRSRRGASVVALVRRVKTYCPGVAIVVACLDQLTSGRDVLSVARAGAEHFAFDQIDDVDAVLRSLVAPGGPDAPERRSSKVDQMSIARARATARRSGQRLRYATPAASIAVLPPATSPLLRRIVYACLGSDAPRDVAGLAERVELSRRSLARETLRRGWPSPSALLQWGRLFRGAVAAAQARMVGLSWPQAQLAIAEAAGYRTPRTAARAFRSRAGITLANVWRDGAAALVPAFLAATGAGLPPHRLAS